MSAKPILATLVTILIVVLYMLGVVDMGSLVGMPTEGWDYSVQTVSLSSETLGWGEELEITAFIENTGTKLGTVYVVLGIQYPNGSRIYPAAQTLYDIRVGDTRHAVFRWYTREEPLGDYHVDIDVYNPSREHMFATTEFSYHFTVKEDIWLLLDKLTILITIIVTAVGAAVWGWNRYKRGSNTKPRFYV